MTFDVKENQALADTLVRKIIAHEHKILQTQNSSNSGSDLEESNKNNSLELSYSDPKNLETFLLRKIQQLSEAGTSAVLELKDVITAGQDPREITAFSELLQSTSKVLELLQQFVANKDKIHLLSQKMQQASSLNDNKSLIGQQNNLQVIVTSREELLKALQQKSQKINNYLEHNHAFLEET